MRSRMSVESSSPGGIRRVGSSSNDERAALEGMLKGYPIEQLVEEVLIAWDELGKRNDELVAVKQRLRVVELDLAERQDNIAPEVARLAEAEQTLKENEAQIIHLERLLTDARDELASQQSSLSQQERSSMEGELEQLRTLTTEQDEVIGEMEGRISQMVEALEKAADAGLTSVTADEVRLLKQQVDERQRQLDVEKAAAEALEEERQRLRDIADRLRGLLDARDRRLAELEEQLERVMQGPRSVSAEHDYLVEQIEELKRRLLERNREYESLRRRERRLHNDVFERDERLQQITLTMTDLEAALQDRTAELRELEGQRSSMEHELHSARRSERTREAWVGSLPIRCPLFEVMKVVSLSVNCTPTLQMLSVPSRHQPLKTWQNSPKVKRWSLKQKKPNWNPVWMLTVYARLRRAVRATLWSSKMKMKFDSI